MMQFGLIGYPLGHSLSPVIHKTAMESCGMEGTYSLFPILPDDKQGLLDLLSRLRTQEIQGLNITIPHKQIVIPFLDVLTPTANAIGAVNTIYLRDGNLIGDNTDALGFLSDLARFMSNHESRIPNQRSAIVLGAGGAARAVVYALLNAGWNVTVVARRIEQAQGLAESFANLRIGSDFFSIEFSDFTLVVNATPIGMAPNIGSSPLLETVNLHSGTYVYDLVYNPRETKLVRNARGQGLRATTGLGMLIEQAALSFEIWTNCSPSRAALFEAVK